MIWVLTFIYFVAISLVLWGGFVLYASLLLLFGRLGTVARIIGGGATYIAFAFLLVIPIFIGLSISNWRANFNENIWYMFFFMACYLLSTFPGGIFFKTYYLQKLKTVGYFKDRRNRP